MAASCLLAEYQDIPQSSRAQMAPTKYFVRWPLLMVYFCRCLYFTFLSTSTSMHVAKNSCCEALVWCVFRSQNWAAKAVASAVLRMSCSSWVHAGCYEAEVRGFFPRLPSRRCTRTHCAPSERALLHTKGFCGASKIATALGVKLYVDMAAVC